MSKNNAVEDFLSGVNGDNENLDKLPEENIFGDMGLEQDPEKVDKTTEETPKAKEDDSEEDELPFNKNPKLKRYIDKEVARLTQHLTPREREDVKEKIEQEPDLVSAFTRIIGNDTPEKVDALRLLGDTVNKLKADARAGTELLEAERRAEREAQEALSQGFENIEDNFNVDLTSNDPTAKKTRAEFIDFIRRVAPKNEYGEITDYPDFQETFTLFQEIKKKQPVSNNRAKELASRGMERSGDASKIPALADPSWKGVDKFLSTLKG